MSSKRIVLIGGGHTHALVLHALAARPIIGADITVINPGTTAPYSGMLPGFVAGHYSRAELDIDLVNLTESAGARLVVGSATGLDPRTQTVHLGDGTRLAYDLSSFDVGITSRMDQLEGFAKNAVPAKPLAVFATRWDTFRKAPGRKEVAILGGGIAGAELAMAMSFALRDQPATIRLLDRGTILSANSVAAQKHVRKGLQALNVEILENVQVQAVTESGILLDGGARIEANLVIGAAGATPHPWIKNTQLHLHEGFIVVDPTLQSSQAGVFAVGDCAHMSADPRPKAGVYAVRQAPILTENLRRSCMAAPLKRYLPQSDYMKLVSLGSQRAFGEKFGFAISGNLVWRMKDRIDRMFMHQFGG